MKLLQLKVKGMNVFVKECAIIFDEMSIRKSLVYNSSNDVVEGYESFGGSPIQFGISMTVTTVVTKLLEHSFPNFGVPMRIHSDQGRQFEGKVLQELCHSSGSIN